MKAAYITSWGAPLDVIEVGPVDDPIVGPDGILVDVAAAGVNPVDWKIVAGGLQGAFPCAFPLIPGWDVAGAVVATGPAVTTVAVGDRVAAYARKDHIQFGTFAEQMAVPERAIARVPDGVALDVAGALPLAGLTAEQLLDRADVDEGDVVLLHAAAGGVGRMAGQLALRRGARVIGTASAANHDLLEERGIEPVDYRGDVVSQVRELATDGVDVVLDLVGGEALAATPQLLKPSGRLGGIVDPAAMRTIAEEHGFQDRYVFVRPDGPMLARLLAMVADDRLRVDICARFGLDQTARALEESRSGHTRGKIVITVSTGSE